jgi:hypothetical protein
MFQSYSLKGKIGRIESNNDRSGTRQMEDRQPLLVSKSPDEKVVGVLPLPRLFHQPSPLSRCPSPDTQSERSFDNSEGRRSGDSMFDDDVIIVRQDVNGRSSGEMERLGVMSKSQTRKQISSSDLAFLSMDPYACTRGPVMDQQKRRPPPLALTISNGKTHSMPDRIPQARLAPNAIRQNDHVERPPPQRISSLPFTPFARPRVAPAPPQMGRCSSESMVRPRLGADLPVDVSLTSEPNEEVVVVADPHRKGRSFFIEDESPVHGTFGMSLAKKITLKGMGESWKKAVANRI